MQVERGVLVVILGFPSGEWVSNALVTCPEERNNSGKLELIPHVASRVRGLLTEGVIRFGRDLRPISSLVG
jgi:hypothetical protein